MLTPDGLRDVLMTSTMAYFDQMKRDIEVRIATVLALKDTGLSRPTMIKIAESCADDIVEMLRYAVISSGELEKLVGKLI
jgi:hypothetical protein